MISKAPRNWSVIALSVLVYALGTASADAQKNLLLNPNADDGTEFWRVIEQSTVEKFNGDNVFVLRYGCAGGSALLQDVNLKASDAGKYALFMGRGSSERINSDGAITGLPYLYGYMMESNDPKGGRIIAYLQGQHMRAAPTAPDEWVTMFGVFRVPERTVAIRFFLEQAERKGVPQNGSAARFDNLGLYLFDTEQEALQFTRSYK